MVKKWLYVFPMALIVIGALILLGVGEQTPNVNTVAREKISWLKLQEITAPAAQWSQNYSTPSGLFKIMPVDGNVEVLFSNGFYIVLDPLEQVDMGRVSAEYRLRGVGKETLVSVFTAKAM